MRPLPGCRATLQLPPLIQILAFQAEQMGNLVSSSRSSPEKALIYRPLISGLHNVLAPILTGSSPTQVTYSLPMLLGPSRTITIETVSSPYRTLIMFFQLDRK